ncbi:MAG: glycosyltransferase family 2 protein [Candidatus Coatesbacteria bacterium]|nr:glycosyltransferase family 2 protein [Candidatus Coatesbacteria bacterium]
MKPLISVVIATYNRKDLVLEAIRSVQNQTINDWEILLGDDGSTDGTSEMIKSLEESRLRYNWEINRGGPSYQRNWGMKNSEGKYIAFLDSDDLWTIDKLEKQVSFMEQNNEIGLSHTFMMNRDNKRVIEKEAYKNGMIFKELFLSSNFISTSTVIMRRDILKTTGYMDETLKIAQDFDYWLRVSKDNQIMLVNESLTEYRANMGIAGDIIALANDILVIIKKNFENGSVSGDLAKEREKKLYYDIPYLLGGSKKAWMKFFSSLFFRKQREISRRKVLERMFFEPPGLTKLPLFGD